MKYLQTTSQVDKNPKAEAADVQVKEDIMHFAIMIICAIYIKDWLVIRRAKKGKRSAIFLMIWGTINFIFAFVSCFSCEDKYLVSCILLTSVFTINNIVIIFLSDYIVNKIKKQ